MTESVKGFLKDLGFTFFSLYVEMAFFLLLGIGAVAVVSLFLSPQKVGRILHLKPGASFGRRMGVGVKAAALGIPLPLCSCSVLPMAYYFKKNGVSRGALVSFLISTPTTGADSILVYYGLLGFPAAIVRVLSSLILGIGGAFFIEAVDPSEEEVSQTHICEEAVHSSWKKRLRDTLRYSFFTFLDEMYINLIVGIFVAALIVVLLGQSESFLEPLVGGGFFSYVLVMIIAMPLYLCATSSVPLAVGLIAGGMSIGTAFVLLTAGPVISLPSFFVLHKIFSRRTLFWYLFYIGISSVILGYAVDGLYHFYGWPLPSFSVNINDYGVWTLTGAAIFTFFWLLSLLRSFGIGRSDCGCCCDSCCKHAA